MEKKLYIKFRQFLKNKFIYLFFIILILISILIINFESFQTQKGLTPLIKLETKFSTFIQKSLSSSFNLVYQKCLYSDGISPKNFKCYNFSGFSSSIIESLESLYLLNMKVEFEKVKNFLINSFDCSKLQWVNRHEFWSRIIGSFIGTYIISKDNFFLKEAEKCVNILLEPNLMETIYEFINLNLKIGKNKQFKNGISLSEISSGLPELISLYILTKNEKYLISIEEILQLIPKFNYLNSAIYNLTTQSSNLEMSILDGFGLNFYYNLALSYYLKDLPEIQTILQSLPHISRLNSNSDPSNFYSILEISEIMNLLENPLSIPMEFKIKDYLNSQYNNSRLPMVRQSEDSPKSGFNFESLPIRYLIKESLINNNNKLFNHYQSLIVSILTSTQLGKGFCSMRMTRKGLYQKSNYQSSNLFGQWFTLSSFIASGHQKLLLNSLFNDRGHLIASNSLFNFTR